MSRCNPNARNVSRMLIPSTIYRPADPQIHVPLVHPSHPHKHDFGPMNGGGRYSIQSLNVSNLSAHVVQFSSADYSESYWAQAMTLLLERSKLLVEGAGAVGLAAVLGGGMQVAGERVAVVLSGGNVDAHLIARVVERGMAHAGRYLVLRVTLEDRPGQLNRLLNIVSSSEANVLDIGHLRHAPSVHMEGAEGATSQTEYASQYVAGSAHSVTAG